MEIEAQKGQVVILWNVDFLDITLMKQAQQELHVMVQLSFHGFLTAVYAYPDLHIRMSL